MVKSDFVYSDVRFADIQMLRYRLNGFEELTLRQKMLVYCLSQATLWGRDITFDQFGKYNLRIRKTLEAIYTDPSIDHGSKEFGALEEYLKRVWFSNGIYHHYGCEKFLPGFSESYFCSAVKSVSRELLPLKDGEDVESLLRELAPVMFCPEILPKRVNKKEGEDLLLTSACNYYEGVTQVEAENFYRNLKAAYGDNAPSFGLNTTLVKRDGSLLEVVWKEGGKYGKAIREIVLWLEKACEYAENDAQLNAISTLIKYYKTGDIKLFDDYSIEWVNATEGKIDFVNGFIEVYGDPIGIKGSWEGIVEYKDDEATQRTRTISSHAQWFEDNSPIDPRFRKHEVKGVTANVVCAAMLGGDEYPSTAIGINLPNADWIRAQHGSKSVTIGNLTDAYNKAAQGNGFYDEFVIDEETRALVTKYGDLCDDLHTDLHECLGHGSGRLAPGTNPDALKAYGNTIEEARADLFALYYLADKKMLDLGLVPDMEAFKSQYYTYMMNGMMAQLVRIAKGASIEEAHMRNRALIANWCHDNGNAVELVVRDGKSYVRIKDYAGLRILFARLLAEIQRIKSEGDFNAARNLVERYAVKVNPVLHDEVLERYAKLNIAPYKGFINPVLVPVCNANGEIVDVQVDYSESYVHQMLRYSSEYSALV